MNVKKKLEKIGKDAKQLQPKLIHRFIVDIDGIPPSLIYSIDRPKGLNIHFKSSLPHSMVLYDTEIPSGENIVMEWLKSEKQKDIKIYVLNAIGQQISLWTYKKVKIDTITFSPLNWSGDIDGNEDDKKKYIEIFHLNTTTKHLKQRSQISRIIINFIFDSVEFEDLTK